MTLICSALLLLCPKSTYADSLFFHSVYPQTALTLAQTQGKFVCVFFTDSTCNKCPLFLQKVTNHKKINKLLSRHYVSVLADFSSIEGQAWQNTYGFNTVPGALVLNADGTEFHRHINQPSMAELYRSLQQLVRLPRIPGPPSALFFEEIDQPDKPTFAQQVHIPLEVFYVQAGAFSSSEAAENHVNSIYAKSALAGIVHREFREEKLLYIVRFGYYNNQNEAIKVLSIIRNNGFTGFIKKL